MYVIKADGKLLYSPELIDDGYKLISPRMHLEINAAGSLDFTMPPCNVLYDEVMKMKSIITVEQDGEVVFRGRIFEESVDTFKQRRIYCEGDLSFLLDSLQGPATFTGTQFDLFSQLIASHNAQMDDEKQFALGDVSGLDAEETFSFTSSAYSDTMTMVQTYIIDLFGGYIQTRTEGGVHYIDYVDGFNDECSQTIEFGVNLLNFESQINAQELCTVLVPLGATGEDSAALTIASVNDGKVYIENTEAVERFGRVYRTYTWENVTDPEELKELGIEYMNGAGIPETLTITAVDMHLLDVDVEKIRNGRMVHLKSKPHGLDKKKVCASIDADLENGDQTVFTFGLPRQMLKTLAEQAAENAAGLGGVYSDIGDIYTEIDNTEAELGRVSGKVEDQHKWLTETETSLNIAVGNIDLIGHRLNLVAIDVDAAEAEIALRAYQEDVDVLGKRVSGAEIRIDGAEAAITLKAERSTVDSMGERLSTAELRIDGAESSITLLAEEIRLAGYVTMDEFETVQGWATDFSGVSISGSSIIGGYGDFDSLVCGTLNGGTPATQEWVAEQGYLTSASGAFATQSWVIDQGYAKSTDVAQTLTNFVMDVELEGYATQAWVTENFSKASATYKPTVIERYGSLSGTSIPVQTLNESGEVLLTGTVDAGDVYTNGKNSVTLSVGGWYGGSNTVTASNGKTATVSLPSFSASGGDTWSSNQTTVYFYTGSVSGYLASKTVDATSVYNSGWNECRDACSSAEVYTISEYAPGTLYVKVGDYYSSAGSSWVKVTRKYGVYTLPSAK